MKDIDTKKLIILNLPFVLFFYLANKTSQSFRLAEGADLGARIFNLNTGFAAAFSNPSIKRGWTIIITSRCRKIYCTHFNNEFLVKYNCPRYFHVVNYRIKRFTKIH